MGLARLPTYIVDKAQWVDHHLDLFRTNLTHYIESGPIKVETFDSTEYLGADFVASGARYWQLRTVIAKEPPVELALQAGDAVQNLRSLLDYLAHAVVMSLGGRPVAGARGTRFPIMELHRNKGAEIAGCSSEELRTLVGELQPYASADPKNHPLYRLNHLANKNKHRSIPLATAAGGVPAIYALLERDAPTIRGIVVPTSRWMGHMDVLGPLIYPTASGKTPQALGVLDPFITFDLSGDRVVSALSELSYLRDYVFSVVINQFGTFFAGPFPSIFDAGTPIDPMTRAHVEVHDSVRGTQYLLNLLFSEGFYDQKLLIIGDSSPMSTDQRAHALD